MSVESLCEEMLDALETFDRNAAPFGLYAAGDMVPERQPPEKMRDWRLRTRHQEWFAALKPYLNELGGRVLWDGGDEPNFRFALPNFGEVRLHIAKVSKIKVRKYGSAYRVDKHENFVQRWDELRLDKAMGELRSLSHSFLCERVKVQMLLFLGFDRAARPFERELAQLKAHRNHAAHGVTFVSRQWEDPHGRNFWTRAALWARLNNEEKPLIPDK